MPWAFIREGSFAFRFVLANHNLKGNYAFQKFNKSP